MQHVNKLTFIVHRLVFDQDTGRTVAREFHIELTPRKMDWLFQRAKNNRQSVAQAIQGALKITCREGETFHQGGA